MVGMSSFDESLHPRGQASNAGQFRTKENDAPTGELAEPPLTGVQGFLARKRAALLQRGFVPATPGPTSSGTPRQAAGLDSWWTEAIARSEVRLDGKSYPQMPDDYTPSGGAGRALSGKRRTYRKLYQSGEIAVRMPSAAAIRRFSAEIGNDTFDFPISAEGPAGNPVSGHVRVTQTAPGCWAVTAINMPPAAQEKIGEAVNAILEARRPSYALADAEHAGGLVARARERRAAAGVKLAAIESSSWMRSAGYNDDTGEMIVDLQGRQYGYTTPRGVYEYMVTAPSPGAAYNALVKGRYDSHPVTSCPNCSRWFAEGTRHHCTAHRAPGEKVSLHNQRVRAYVMGEPLPV